MSPRRAQPYGRYGPSGHTPSHQLALVLHDRDTAREAVLAPQPFEDSLGRALAVNVGIEGRLQVANLGREDKRQLAEWLSQE